VQKSKEGYLNKKYVGGHFVFCGPVLRLVEKAKAKAYEKPSYIILHRNMVVTPLPKVVSHSHWF
jgi:hypothetical protein